MLEENRTESPEMEESYLGLDKKPGDRHYRAYVGPPNDYDFIAAMSFNLLTCLGLRQHHRVLDVGCGSLRVGRLLIPYLNKGNYIGYEPNQWLVEAGIDNEVGGDQINIKKPQFFGSDGLGDVQANSVDYILVHSIFSHCGADLLEDWLENIFRIVKDDGFFLATYVRGLEDTIKEGWVYPGCVEYTEKTIKDIALNVGFNSQSLYWYHPRQEWLCFHKDKNTSPIFENGVVTWNKYNYYSQESSEKRNRGRK